MTNSNLFGRVYVDQFFHPSRIHVNLQRYDLQTKNLVRKNVCQKLYLYIFGLIYVFWNPTDTNDHHLHYVPTGQEHQQNRQIFDVCYDYLHHTFQLFVFSIVTALPVDSLRKKVGMKLLETSLPKYSSTHALIFFLYPLRSQSNFSSHIFRALDLVIVAVSPFRNTSNKHSFIELSSGGSDIVETK